MRIRTKSGNRTIAVTGTETIKPPVPPISFAVSYAYALRALVMGYVGALIRLRRASDDAESDFFATDEGVIDTAAIATWLGGSDGFVTTWYDQSGNGRNVVHATDANQPKFASDNNGRPAILFDGVNDYFRDTGLNLAQPLEVVWVWQSVVQPATESYFFDSAAAARRCLSSIQSTGFLGFFGGLAAIETAEDFTNINTHYTSVQFDGVSSLMRHDAVQVAAGSAGTEKMDGITVGASVSPSRYMDGHIYELIVSSAGILSGGERTALEANQAAYYQPLPLDAIVSAYAYSLRSLRSAYTDPLIRLRRDSDDAESDFSADANGVIDVAAIVAWLDGADGFITTWYDQSGNARDAVQTTDAFQPKYVAEHNGKPAILWDATDSALENTGTTLTQPIEVSGVWQTNSTSGVYLFDAAAGGGRCTCWIQAGLINMYAGATIADSADLSDADTHYSNYQFNGTSGVLRADGSQRAAGDVSTQSLVGLTLGQRIGTSQELDGHLYELIVKPSLFSAGERTALEADQASFYGVS